ncbi:MAG: hypothetical protein ABIT37_12620 [Luteolibacter sp.]
MKIPVYAAALLLGGLIGTVLVRAVIPSQGGSTGSETTGSRKTARIPEPVGVSISRMISSESAAMDESVPINKALDVLFAERKSPMRTRAFLKNRIQMMTTDQLTQALMNGDVQSPAELREVAQRLAKEDPEGTFSHLVAQELRVYGMENTYTFVDALLQIWGDSDAVAVMNRLKMMKRGGSQQDFSLRFSGYWAKIDPAAAARNFDDLIYLRNMQDRGDMVFTDNSYAGEIVKSWKQKDEDTMREYIANLPAGREKNVLDSALKKLDEPKH